MNRKVIPILFAIGTVAFSGGVAHADDFSARLNGFNEVGGLGAGETGAILTNGNGTLRLDLDHPSIKYTLTFADLTSAATQAHIHFGKVHVAGGIMAWLCQSATKPSPTPGTPTCPAGGGSVSGTLTAANVLGLSGQNVTAGVFDALTDALTSNTAYANVHTVNFPAGEIRGQVRKSDREDE